MLHQKEILTKFSSLLSSTDSYYEFLLEIHFLLPCFNFSSHTGVTVAIAVVVGLVIMIILALVVVFVKRRYICLNLLTTKLD